VHLKSKRLCRQRIVSRQNDEKKIQEENLRKRNLGSFFYKNRG